MKPRIMLSGGWWRVITDGTRYIGCKTIGYASLSLALDAAKWRWEMQLTNNSERR